MLAIELCSKAMNKFQSTLPHGSDKKSIKNSFDSEGKNM